MAKTQAQFLSLFPERGEFITAQYKRIFRTLSDEDINDYIRTGRKYTRQRISRLGGKVNPATTGLIKKGGIGRGRISDLTFDEKWREAQRYADFLHAQTSTVKGDKLWEQRQVNAMPELANLSTEDKRFAWLQVDNLRQTGVYERAVAQIGSDETIDRIFQMVNAGYSGNQAIAKILSVQTGIFVRDVADEDLPFNEEDTPSFMNL